MLVPFLFFLLFLFLGNLLPAEEVFFLQLLCLLLCPSSLAQICLDIILMNEANLHVCIQLNKFYFEVAIVNQTMMIIHTALLFCESNLVILSLVVFFDCYNLTIWRCQGIYLTFLKSSSFYPDQFRPVGEVLRGFGVEFAGDVAAVDAADDDCDSDDDGGDDSQDHIRVLLHDLLLGSCKIGPQCLLKAVLLRTVLVFLSMNDSQMHILFV